MDKSLFEIAIEGRLDEELDLAERRIAGAIQYAVFSTAEELKVLWRHDIQSSGLQNADRLAKTIQQQNYGTRPKSMGPASVVKSKFPIIQEAFEKPTIIRARAGNFILVPNPAVWSGGRVRQPRRAGNQTSSIATAEARFGPLKFVARPGKSALLVATMRASSTRPGAFRRASPTALRTGRGLSTVVVFFLVPQSQLPKMLHGRVIRERFARNAPRSVERKFIDRMNASDAPLRLAGPTDD